MTCPQCSREIKAGSLSCPYCGKIFARQRAGSPPSQDNQPQNTGLDGPPKKQERNSANDDLENRLKEQEARTGKEIKKRRWQRWVFYALGSLLFIGGVAYMVAIMNENSRLVADVDNLNVSLEKTKTDLESTKSKLTESQNELANLNSTLETVRGELSDTNDNLKEVLDENESLEQDIMEKNSDVEELNQAAESAQANVVNLLIELGVEMSADELKQIPLAAEQLTTTDTDGDGLSDSLEAAIGTDPNMADTDDDGYDDKSEATSGYNPAGEGAWPVDNGFIENHKGDIILQYSGNDMYAWFVSQSGSRYYLGRLSDDFAELRQSTYWTKPVDS